MTVIQTLSLVVTTRTQCLTNSVIHETVDHFGLQHPLFPCTSSHSTQSNCKCTVLQVTFKVPPMSYSWRHQPCLNGTENTFTLHSATTHRVDIVKNIFW